MLPCNEKAHEIIDRHPVCRTLHGMSEHLNAVGLVEVWRLCHFFSCDEPERLAREIWNRRTKKMKLTKGLYALVEHRDYLRLRRWKWTASTSGNGTSGMTYAARWARHGPDRNREKIYMHREILGCSAGLEADHRNSNPIDNRRENLQAIPKQKNLWRRGINKTEDEDW